MAGVFNFILLFISIVPSQAQRLEKKSITTISAVKLCKSINCYSVKENKGQWEVKENNKTIEVIRPWQLKYYYQILGKDYNIMVFPNEIEFTNYYFIKNKQGAFFFTSGLYFDKVKYLGLVSNNILLVEKETKTGAAQLLFIPTRNNDFGAIYFQPWCKTNEKRSTALKLNKQKNKCIATMIVNNEDTNNTQQNKLSIKLYFDLYKNFKANCSSYQPIKSIYRLN